VGINFWRRNTKITNNKKKRTKSKSMKAKKVFLGCDHAGYETKEKIKKILQKLKADFEDCTKIYDPEDDYPEYAAKVAKQVAKNRGSRGILVCGTGIGMSIAANKIRGVRAALCRTEYDVKMTRMHNDANILVLAGNAKHSDADLANMLSAFFTEEFEGGRHLRRINKIRKLER
jgi:ribose 5-phosphate isomerase B